MDSYEMWEIVPIEVILFTKFQYRSKLFFLRWLKPKVLTQVLWKFRD